MKISKAKLKQIIKEELDRELEDSEVMSDYGIDVHGNREDDDSELMAILDEPILEGILMEIDPSIATGLGVGLGIILAYFTLNGAATAAVLAAEALRTYVSRREVKKFEEKARQVEQREQSLLDTLTNDPEIMAILDKHNDLADYLGKKAQRGKRSKELQGQRAELKELAKDLRNKIEARARELQDEIGGYVPRPGKKKVQQHRDQTVLDPHGLAGAYKKQQQQKYGKK
jgi:hypothetical protein